MKSKCQQDYLDSSQIMVEFSLMGDFDDIEKISKDLNMNATDIRKKNEFKIKEFAEDSWSISTDYQNSLDVSEVFEKLINMLKGKENTINKIKELYNLDTIFIVVVKANIDKMPMYILTKEIINFASYINTQIHFDNYIFD